MEVAHEALLQQWPPLRQAIEADRTSLRLRSELKRLAADWEQGSRDESYLLRGARLATVDQWAGEHGGELGAVEDQFLQASRAAAARELEAARRSQAAEYQARVERRRAWRARLAATTLALLLAIGVVLTTYSTSLRQEWVRSRVIGGRPESVRVGCIRRGG